MVNTIRVRISKVLIQEHEGILIGSASSTDLPDGNSEHSSFLSFDNHMGG